MDQKRWTLKVRFDTPEAQIESDPELAFPDDEMSLFVRYLTDRWDLYPEDWSGDEPDSPIVSWSGTELVAGLEVLDLASEVLEWLVMRTSPPSVELIRNEPR